MTNNSDSRPTATTLGLHMADKDVTAPAEHSLQEGTLVLL